MKPTLLAKLWYGPIDGGVVEMDEIEDALVFAPGESWAPGWNHIGHFGTCGRPKTKATYVPCGKAKKAVVNYLWRPE